jgi:hypothetical protein
MPTRTLAEKKAAFTFTKTFAKKRQADFGNLNYLKSQIIFETRLDQFITNG